MVSSIQWWTSSKIRFQSRNWIFEDLNWSSKSNVAAWPVPGHEASSSNKCPTKFWLKRWHFWGMTSIFALYHVSGTLKLTKIRLRAWPSMGKSLKFHGHDEKCMPGTFLCGVEGSSSSWSVISKKIETFTFLSSPQANHQSFEEF